MTPGRLRRSRAKGSRLTATNGLPIVVVSRPSRWGNPFPIDTSQPAQEVARLRALAVKKFERALHGPGSQLGFTRADVRRELKGKNLACWCPLDGPCHADVLLRVANDK
ncbi:MAG: DUF4326 domain-containing protein [Pseudomonadota bacterium]